MWLLAAAASADIYKWVDKDGRVRYSDQPPPDTSQAHEINTSNVPLALQKRLRQMDPGFSIKRISGNLEVAWVCLTAKATDYEEPPFVTAFKSSDLGDIQPGASAKVQYDDEGNLRRGGGTALCPERQADGSDLRWIVYEIRFDPKAVKIYRGAQ